MKYDPTRSIRAQRKLAQGQKCPYCKREMLGPTDVHHDTSERMATIEHIVTQGRGGETQASNMIWVCRRCNNLRGDIPYEVFVQFARIIIVQYPEIPKPFLRNALREFILHLALGALGKRSALNHAVSMGLLRLADDMGGGS